MKSLKKSHSSFLQGEEQNERHPSLHHKTPQDCFGVLISIALTINLNDGEKILMALFVNIWKSNFQFQHRCSRSLNGTTLIFEKPATPFVDKNSSISAHVRNDRN